MKQREKHFRRKEKVKGQFFTPQEVADFIVNFLALHTRKRGVGIDPACGDGAFLSSLARAGFREVVGIDVDDEILKRVPLQGRVSIFVHDSLKPFLGDLEGKADIVVGNPPFSAKYGRITEQEILERFELGRGRKSQAIEVLFLERFVQLARPEGLIGIILPNGVFSSLPLRYVREFLLENLKVLGIITLPRRVFRGKTAAHTCILLAQKGRHSGPCFMGVAGTLQDLALLLRFYRRRSSAEKPFACWMVPSPDSFSPPKSPSFDRSPHLEDLLEGMRSGATEYGGNREFASKGIPFISARTVTWLGVDFTRDRRFVQPGSPMDKGQAHTRVGDVLFVRVGVGCSGRAAVVTDPSEEGVADDWIYIIRPKVSPFYLALFFATHLGKSQIETIKRGVGTVTIPQRLLKGVYIPLPPPDLERALKTGYLEMVRLRREGRREEAQAMFQALVGRIEEWLGSGSSLNGLEGGSLGTTPEFVWSSR